jgi:hypothetical protein
MVVIDVQPVVLQVSAYSKAVAVVLTVAKFSPLMVTVPPELEPAFDGLVDELMGASYVKYVESSAGDCLAEPSRYVSEGEVMYLTPTFFLYKDRGA